MRLGVVRGWCCGLLAGGMVAAPLQAQDSLPPWEGGLTNSLGQPSRIRLHVGASLGLDWRRGASAASVIYGTFGVTRRVGNPVVGLLATSAEAYGGLRSTGLDGGIRALLQLPLLRLSLGGDYNIRDDRLGVILGLTMPVRRGGVFGGGSLVRVEWSPGPMGALRGSVLVPVGQSAAGHTRPRTDRVSLTPPEAHSAPRPPPVRGLDESLARLGIIVGRLGHLLTPHLDRPGPDPRKELTGLLAELRAPPRIEGITGPGLDIEGWVRAYHAELERAFSIAASGGFVSEGATTAEGEIATASALMTLRDHVLYPYNRLLGQWKTPGTIGALAAHARGNFARDIVSLTTLSPEREEALLFVFERILGAVTELEREQRSLWGDSRAAWLPLQLGLRPEDHDTQAELDAIVEAAVGVRFTNGNRVWYVINEEFRAEVVRSIQRAEDYHVLWVHDFRGRNDAGLPDTRSMRYVLDAYLRALTARVREYDHRRRLPVYLIFLDQHHYELNQGKLWLDVLERPLDRTLKLPAGFEAFSDSIRVGLEELRAAVAGSRLLQAETRQYGDAWLRNRIKVHVNITNPVDPSFWSRQIVPLIGVPDDIMRDHRKIVFYDISEEDPYRGLAIYTGMGIGEHYAGPTWEDRSLMVQGPAVLPLKTQARRLLESQGIRGDRMPYPLRARPLAPGYEAKVTAEIARPGGQGQRAVELHNQTGFEEKQVSVARATLYGLMPPGSVVKVPDSLWGNALYAALLTGSALRGCRVLFVAPALTAAPSSGWPQMGVAHDLFARLIVLQQEFGPELEAVGGMLKTGFYNPGVGVEQIAARFAGAYRNARRTPFLRRLFPTDPSVDSLLAHASELLPPPAPDSGPALPQPEVVPKLHLKANFFASPEGWDRLISRPEMAQVLEAYIGQLIRTDPEQADVRAAAEALATASDRLVAAHRASLSPAERERLMYYLLVGSANADYRSMQMDGEASVLLSGWSGIVGLIDLSLIVNLSVWIDDLEMLDALLPPPNDFQRGAARLVRPAL